LDFAGRWDYVGPIPGCPDTHIEFRKSEAGFEGIIEANEEAYEFHGAPLLEVAAAVGVALGWDIIAPSELLTKAQLDAVGGQMDLLVKATYLRKTQDKAGTTTRTPHAAPLAPDAPTASKKPKGPAMGGEAQATPIKPKSEECEKCTKTPCKCKKKVRVKKSQAAVECSVCGAAQWSGDTLTLCHCLRDLRKSVKSTEIHNGYEVEFGSNWAATDIQVFLDMVQE
jgi:hypothetical protein